MTLDASAAWMRSGAATSLPAAPRTRLCSSPLSAPDPGSTKSQLGGPTDPSSAQCRQGLPQLSRWGWKQTGAGGFGIFKSTPDRVWFASSWHLALPRMQAPAGSSFVGALSSSKASSSYGADHRRAKQPGWLI